MRLVSTIVAAARPAATATLRCLCWSLRWLCQYLCQTGFVARIAIATVVALTVTTFSYWAQSSGRADAPAPIEFPRLQSTDKSDRLDAYMREARATSGLGDATASSDASALVQWPLVNRITTGVRVGPRGERAYGIRIAVPVGTPVRAAADGVIDFAGNSSDGYGKKVVIKHGAIETVYAHVSEILVKKSDKVRKGQLIAKSGQSGFATSPRLYLGIIGAGTSVDPIAFFGKAGMLDRCPAANGACKPRETPAKPTATAMNLERRPVPPSDIPVTRPQRPDNL